MVRTQPIGLHLNQAKEHDMNAKSTTTTETRLMACPVCREDINATVAFDVSFEQNLGEGDDRPLNVAAFSAKLKPVGLRINHDCPPKPTPRIPSVTINHGSLS